MKFFIFLIFFLSACMIPKVDDAVENRIEKNELTAVLLVRSGIEYYMKSRYVDAEFAFRKALELYPETFNIEMNLAASLLAQGQTDQALELYRKLQIMQPANADLMRGIAESFLAKRELVLAKALYEQIVEIYIQIADYQKAAEIEARLAEAYLIEGNLIEAACHFKKSFELVANPDIKASYYRLAVINNMIGAQDLLASGRELRALDVQELFALMLLSYGSADYKKVLEIDEVLASRKLKQVMQFEVDFLTALAKLKSSDQQDSEEEPKINFVSERQISTMPAKVVEDLEELAKTGRLQTPDRFQLS